VEAGRWNGFVGVSGVRLGMGGRVIGGTRRWLMGLWGEMLWICGGVTRVNGSCREKWCEGMEQ